MSRSALSVLLLVTAALTASDVIHATASPASSHRQRAQENNRHDVDAASQSRSLQSVGVTDATTNFVHSTESIFDHMIVLDGTDNVSFHWNDISGDQIKGRLIHKANSIEQAPTWLGFGVYHSNHDYTTLPTSSDSFMAGSSAMIGLVSEEPETETPVKHYLLADKMVDQIQETTDSSIISSSIVQHDGDDGTVTTELTFTKNLQGSPSESTELRRDGTNVFLWAVGPPGGTLGVLGKHSFKGVLFLDFAQVRNQVEGSNTAAGETQPESVPAQTMAPASTQQQQQLPPDNRPNTAPIVTAQCSLTILGQGPGIGKVALTPTSTFSFQAMGDKIQLALEHSGTHPVWLGIASSPNGYMVGSSAIIGSPGNDASAISPPRRYSLMDQDKSGITENQDSSLENASIESVIADGSQEVTTLKFTKPMNDANDPVPILKVDQGTTATFLYAVGEGTDLNYHEHRGQFRLDLSQCGGDIIARSGSSTSSSDTAVWTRSGIFAVHGFFAALAWAFLSPFAVTVAWFRTLVPASWIYIHVFSNVLTALLTFLAFAIAVAGVSKQDGGDHYSKSHHWVGTLLMCIAAFQVVNGFLRPPVERKEPPPSSGGIINNALPPQERFLGLILIPQTPREAWHSIHRFMGITALAMGMYQVQSGMKLYTMRFQTSSIVNYYWMYVGIFVVSLIALKLYVLREEDKARQGVMQAVSTSEPFPEEESEADTVGINGSSTMA